MAIPKIIKEIAQSTVRSEDDVGTKIIIPLFQALKHEDNNRASQFPVYGYQGRDKLPVKNPDYVFFDDPGYAAHSTREDTAWVNDHTLVVVELKKRSESIEGAEGQARFYAYWTKTPLYVITNGNELAVYRIETHFKDKEELRCKISELSEHWTELQRLLNPKVIQEYCDKNKFKALHLHETDYSFYLNNLLTALQKELGSAIPRMIADYKNAGDLFQIKLAGNLNGKPLRSADYTELLGSNKPTLIVAEPGAGKTWLLKMVARDILVNNSATNPQSAPVLIEAKDWRRNYHSLTEAIFKEIKTFLPEITEEIIEDDLKRGKILVLINGLDEAPVSEVDILYTELNRLALLPNIRIIVCSRQETYQNQLGERFNHITIEPLNNEQIKKFIVSQLGEGKDGILYRMGADLLALIRRPLFLQMITSILQNTPNQQLPKNKADLYNRFVQKMLEEWSGQKGLPTLKVSTRIKERILADYSYTLFENPDGDIDLDDIISKVAPHQPIELVRGELIGSGLIRIQKGLVSFYHPSFQEYFLALHVSKLETDQLRNFIVRYARTARHIETFIFLVGLLRNQNKQALLLDFLEEHNLPLFSRCIETRFDLSEQFKENLDKDFSRNYLKQIRESYLRIISSHFSKIAHLFAPWSSYAFDHQNLQFDDLVIAGRLEPTVSRLSYELSLTEEEQSRVIEWDSLHTFYIGTGNPSNPFWVPAGVTTDEGRKVFYDLRQKNLGIDSAREVAFEKAKDCLKEIFAPGKIFWGEFPVLGCENIETILHNFSKATIHNPDIEWLNDFQNISLIKDLDVVIETLKKYSGEISEVYPNGARIPIDYSPQIQLLEYIKTQKLDVNEFLLPEADLISDQSGNNDDAIEAVQDELVFASDKPTNWHNWSDERLCARIGKFYDLFQETYWLMVEEYFPTLKDHLTFYRTGPVKFFVSINKNPELDEYGGVRVRWKQVSPGADTTTVVKIGNWVEENKHHDGLHDFHWFDSKFRGDKSGPEQLLILRGHRNISHYISDGPILQTEILERLKDDLQSALGKF